MINFLCLLFFTGHGNATTIKVPTRVPGMDNIRQVACGNTQTLILSKDGGTVWSCGSGDGGKLGHGDTVKQLSPKVPTNG